VWAVTPASVLVPVVTHAGGLTVLFTQRTAHLRAHSGQVSFPGGRAEPGDPTPEFTALRETQEELGLAPERVEVVARMPEYLTRTGVTR
jgi:8-oxo-dGTP pyrophosphatase MutT (NUDIX family)